MNLLHYYLVIDHIEIHGANSISSPLTYGFPAIPAIVGAVHALNRQLTVEQEVLLDGVMIACHQCEPQIYRSASYADYYFKLSRNPVGKDGKSRPIIEEGKVHLDLSLVIKVYSSDFSLFDDDEEKQNFLNQVAQQLYRQRIAGGSVMQIGRVELIDADAGNPTKQILTQLIPASILMDAQQDLQLILSELQQQQPTATLLDALLETAVLHHIPEVETTAEPEEVDEPSAKKAKQKVKWHTKSIKSGHGWIVPIPVGYQAISPLFAPGLLQDARSDAYPSQFVEAIYGLGKWVFPMRLDDKFEQAFWRYQPVQTLSNGSQLYLVNQQTNQ